MVKPLLQRILRESRVPKKSVFTRLFVVFCFGIPWGRCLAPKRRALPTAPHPEILCCSHIIAKFFGKVKRVRHDFVPFHSNFILLYRNYVLFPLRFVSGDYVGLSDLSTSPALPLSLMSLRLRSALFLRVPFFAFFE